MEFNKFSPKQLQVLLWWCRGSGMENYDDVICDGAVRSGKTLCMSISFVAWAFYKFSGGGDFAICGKTIRSVRRNVVVPLVSVLKSMNFNCTEKLSQNILEIEKDGKKHRFYLFGGKDESSAGLVQGMTLCGVLFDEVALMPRSFVEQALARCSVNGSTFWFNCNPEYPQHWFRMEWILEKKKKNALYFHFTMEDNPSLSAQMISRYKSLYTGTFYKRFIESRWISAQGAVYPFMGTEIPFKAVPDCNFEQYAVSYDYSTVNPASFGLWGKVGDKWYRTKEYYYDSRKEGAQRTDEEHYKALKELVNGKKISAVAVDPSAASFIQVIKRHGEFNVVKANNQVVDGIRRVSALLKDKRLIICNTCTSAIHEFGLYRWQEGSSDAPIKENDHAMDDIRYFATTIYEDDDGFIAVAAKPREAIYENF